MNRKKQSDTLAPWVVLVAVSLIRGVCGPGLNSSAGILFPWVREETGMGVGVLSLFMTVAALAGLVTLYAAKWVFARLGSVKIALLGGGLVTLSFCLLGFGNTPVLWCLPAIPFGVGTVLAVNLLGPTVVHDVFHKDVGLALGVMTTIASLVGAGIHPAFVWLIEGVGWRSACFYLGGGCFVILLLAWLVFSRLTPKEESREEPQKAEYKRVTRSLAGKSLLVFMAVITAFNMFHQHFSTYAKVQGIGTHPLSVALTLSMVGAAIGGILIGKVGDLFGGGYGGLLTLVVGGASCLLFLIGESTAAFVTAATLHGVASSGVGVTVPVLAREFFRGEHYTEVLSRVMLGAPISTILSMPLYGILFDRMGTYQVSLVQLLLWLLFAALMLLFAMKRRQRQRVI